MATVFNERYGPTTVCRCFSMGIKTPRLRKPEGSYGQSSFLIGKYPLVMTNIAMENDPFIDDVPIRTSIYKGFSIAMLNHQMVSVND